MTGRWRAKRAESAGADIVAAQGTEAGGHTGEIGTLALVPQVVDAVKIPVVAAGGIVDGRGVVAALALGAQGAIVGTRFIATPEATAAPAYRAAVAAADQDQTIRTRCYSGKPLRSLRNPYILEHEADPSKIKRFPEQLMISAQHDVMAYWDHADPERTCMPAGQGVGAFRGVQPAAEVFREIVAGAVRVLDAGVFARGWRPLRRGQQVGVSVARRQCRVELAVDVREREQRREDHGRQEDPRSRTPAGRPAARAAASSAAPTADHDVLIRSTVLASWRTRPCRSR
jgi:hypothetical protein